jgi:membrane protease subunit (stomatin/prohibitin family)
MGLIKNALNTAAEAGKGLLGSAGGALLGGITGAANQAMFQEYLASGTMAGDVLMKRAEQIKTNGTSNTKSDANVISSGSVIDVQHNQCMIIVENGRVVEACMEPGRYTYNSSLAPSFLAGEGKFLERFKNTAVEMWEQAKMGGQRRNTQRVYFINMGILDKSINWGVGNVQFRHTQRFVTNAAPYIIGVRVKGNGMARVRIENPLAFYETYGAKYAGGDNSAVITLDTMEEFFKSCKASMIKAITGAITSLGARQEMMYEDITLPENLDKIAKSVNEQMVDTDVCRMGFAFYQFTTNELVIRDEDLQRIQDAQQKAYDVGNINLMNYNVQMGQVEAMKKFGENSNVTDMGGGGMMMMGGMFGGSMGNIQAQPLQQFPHQQMPQQPMATPAADAWQCACGATATGKFCANCGGKKPEPKPAADSWQCACGAAAAGKFCPECGAKKPESTATEGWTCSCGAINKGKFCAECGAKKPADAPLYRCDKCGWEPEDPKNPPKFCPECGDRFDESDVQQ